MVRVSVRVRVKVGENLRKLTLRVRVSVRAKVGEKSILWLGLGLASGLRLARISGNPHLELGLELGLKLARTSGNRQY
eukprot:686883-Amorphochlora_amoeboformis.AAC.1